MAFFLSPIINDQQCDSNGAPLSGGFIYTYLAGSSSNYPTYTDNTGATPQANPIILNTLGLPPSPIWLQSGVAYKFIIRDSLGVLQRTIDNVSGINDANISVSQWVAFGASPTYISATSFSVAGDQTGTFQIGRRLTANVTAGTVYGTITNAVFGTVTTVTVTVDSGALDSGLNSVSLGLLTPTNPSFTPIPKGSVMPFFQAAAPVGWTQVTTHNDKALRVVSGTGGGSGGSVAFSSAIGAGIVGNTTLTTAQIPDHSHSLFLTATVTTVAEGGTGNIHKDGSGSTGTAGLGGGAHTHSFTGSALNIQYIDMILASKN